MFKTNMKVRKILQNARVSIARQTLGGLIVMVLSIVVHGRVSVCQGKHRQTVRRHAEDLKK